MKTLKKHFLLLTTLFVFLIPGCSPEIKTAGGLSIASASPQVPFPAHMTYGSDILQPNHLSKDEQDNLVRMTYKQWKKKYLIMVSGKNSSETQYRITAGSRKRSKSFSEGLGYGMMFAAYMAGFDEEAQTIFDGLLRFVNNNPSNINKSLMAYQVPVPTSQRDSAFDGDADIALALLLADKQWGSTGPVNYRKEAINRINALFDTVIGRESFLPMLGDWVEPDGHRYNQYSVRSSDILPSHFKLFASATSNPKWLLVDERSHAVIDAIQKKFSPISGLVPDFITGSSGPVPTFNPAPPYYLESKYDGQYFYNAARVPWRLGADALLFADKTSQIQVRRMAEWIVNTKGTDPSGIGPGYFLNGRRLSNSMYLSKAFIGPFGVAAMNIKNSQDFVNGVFDLCSGVQQDYYEDSIGLFSLLLMTGNYWLPQ